MAKLNEKRKRFVLEYLKDYNGKQAAIRAGYSPRSAEVVGSQLLRDYKVKEFLDGLTKKAADKALITKEYVLNGFRQVVERSLQAEPVMMKNEDGELVESGEWRFDSTGANGALKALGSHLGIFQSDKVVVDMKFAIEIVQKVQNVLNQTIPDNCPHCKKALSLRPDTIRQLEELSTRI